MLNISHLSKTLMSPFYGKGQGLHTISSIKEIQSSLLSLTNRDLLVLDIDDVLFTPKDRILRGSHRDVLHPMHRIYSMPFEEQKNWYSRCYSQASYQEVEEGTSILLNQVIKKNQVPTIAITAFETPSYGIIEDTVATRLAELSRFNYDFANSSFLEKSFLDILEDGSKPIIASNVIFSSLKGPALKSYLLKHNMTPNRIVVIDDDDKSNLNGILKLFPNAECYHYITASQLPGSLTLELENFQVDYFLKTQKWLSEESVKCKFQKLSNINLS